MGSIRSQFLLILGFVLLLASCKTVPREEMTVRERLHDFEYYTLKYGEKRNYAPLSLKEKDHGFKFKELVRDYKKQVREAKSNEEYYSILRAFVAEFKDAHNAISFNQSNLTGRGDIVYLGFSGVRDGDNLLVGSVMPTAASSPNYPIKPGDVITHINGKSLPDYIREHLLKSRDLGQDQSNITFHMNRIFTRTTLINDLPKEENAVLSVVRDGKKLRPIRMPWIKKDLVDFAADLETIKKMASGSFSDLRIADARSGEEFIFSLTDAAGNPYHRDNADIQTGAQARGILRDFAKAAKAYLDGEMSAEEARAEAPLWLEKALSNFRMAPGIQGWTVRPVDAKVENKEMAFDGTKTTFDPSTLADGELKSAWTRLTRARSIPANVAVIKESQVFPAFIWSAPILDENNRPTGSSKSRGYIRIDSFSPQTKLTETEIIDGVKKALQTFRESGVDEVVVDEIDNGGGSVSLILGIAQAFSAERLNPFGLQFGLNQNWMDDMQGSAQGKTPDMEREIHRRIYDEMVRARGAGKRITKTFEINDLIPHKHQPHAEIDGWQPKIAVLTNEMCASAADMFAAVMKDNGLATNIGGQTMGAGGNVVEHYNFGGSGATIRMTESLLVRFIPDGTDAQGRKLFKEKYIENRGIHPHIVTPTYTQIKTKYAETIGLAYEYLSNPEQFRKVLRESTPLVDLDQPPAGDDSEVLPPVVPLPMPRLAELQAQACSGLFANN